MYFNKPGKENTYETLELAVKTAKEKRIKHIVVASSSGETAEKLKKLASDDIEIVCVTHCYGYPTEGINDMPNEEREKLISSGIKVLTTTHVLSGAERGLSAKFGGVSPVEVMASTLRMFGQGTKVCVEISVMAVDAGLIPYMQPVIAIGGSGHGSDTALIIRTAHANKILDTKIDEVICKPYLD